MKVDYLSLSSSPSPSLRASFPSAWYLCIFSKRRVGRVTDGVRRGVRRASPRAHIEVPLVRTRLTESGPVISPEARARTFFFFFFLGASSRAALVSERQRAVQRGERRDRGVGAQIEGIDPFSDLPRQRFVLDFAQAGAVDVPDAGLRDVSQPCFFRAEETHREEERERAQGASRRGLMRRDLRSRDRDRQSREHTSDDACLFCSSPSMFVKDARGVARRARRGPEPPRVCAYPP